MKVALGDVGLELPWGMVDVTGYEFTAPDGGAVLMVDRGDAEGRGVDEVLQDKAAEYLARMDGARLRGAPRERRVDGVAAAEALLTCDDDGGRIETRLAVWREEGDYVLVAWSAGARARNGAAFFEHVTGSVDRSGAPRRPAQGWERVVACGVSLDVPVGFVGPELREFWTENEAWRVVFTRLFAAGGDPVTSPRTTWTQATLRPDGRCESTLLVEFVGRRPAHFLARFEAGESGRLHDFWSAVLERLTAWDVTGA